MIETVVTSENFDAIVKSKDDKSFDRYYAGRRDLLDRYDMTVALLRGKSVLDIGCAESLLAALVAERRPDIERVVGIDANSRLVMQSKQRLGVDADVRHCYAENLPFASGEFDTVVLGQTLEHVHNAKYAAEEAIRVLKIGGRLIVNVPADDTKPHGNHLRVFISIDDLKNLFGTKVFWDGWGQVHTFHYAWGERG